MLCIVVPTNQTAECAKAYMERTQHSGTFVFDADGSAYKAFAAYHTSYVLVLDKSGTIVHIADGGDQDLSEVVRKAVGR